jgi:hypothetical protein
MSFLLQQTPWGEAISRIKAVRLIAAIKERRRLQLERARTEFGRACASLRWHRGSTLLTARVTERDKRAERRQRRMTSLCDCGSPLQAPRRGRLKRICSDRSLHAEIFDFRGFLAQAKEQQKEGGDVARFVKQKLGWNNVDRLIKRCSDAGIASVWRDLPEETKEIYSEGILSCARGLRR